MRLHALNLLTALLLVASVASAGPTPTQPVRPSGSAGTGSGNQANATQFAQALQAMKEGRTEDARKGFVAVLRSDPKQIESMLALADLAFKDRNDAETQRWLQQAERADAQRGEVHAAWGRYFLNKQQPQKAEASLRKAAAMSPKDATVHRELGDLLMRSNDIKGALAAYGTARSLEPKNAAVVFAMGVAHLNRGEKAQAQTLLREAAKLDEKNPMPWLALAGAATSAAEAEPMLVEALKRKPDAFEALMLRAQWQMRDSAQLPAARKTLEQAAQANPKSAEPLVRLGLLEEAQGRRSEAKRHYLTALERDAFQPIALNNLVMMGLADKEDPSRLELMARRAVKALPTNPQVHDTLAQALRARKDKKGALAAAEQAVKLDGKDAGLRLNLADMQLWVGDRDAARKSAEAVLALNAPAQAAKARELLAKL